MGRPDGQAILNVAEKYGPVDEALILSSHGHIDHLGNNDVLDDILATSKRNYFPRAGRPGLDPKTFFREMYGRGVPYFDYADGLDLDVDAISSLVRGVGADERATPGNVAKLGAALDAAGGRRTGLDDRAVAAAPVPGVRDVPQADTDQRVQRHNGHLATLGGAIRTPLNQT